MFELPELPYAYTALEPHIDAKTMEIHYSKHHQAYVDKLNAALEGQEGLLETNIDTLIQNMEQIPAEARTAVRNNGGGHANHSLFWSLMSPDGGGEPNGELGKAIGEAFGSFADFQSKLKEAGVGRFGSGWAWLCKHDDGLHVCSTPNQDNPLMEDASHKPLLGIDVWEHAYYLKYANKRPDYIDAWWNVVNWPEVAKRYQA